MNIAVQWMYFSSEVYVAQTPLFRFVVDSLLTFGLLWINSTAC